MVNTALESTADNRICNGKTQCRGHAFHTSGQNRKRTFLIDLGMAPVSDVGFGGGGLAASDDGSCLTSFFTVAAASPAPVAEERPITSPRFNLESNRCRIVMKLT